MTDKKFSTNAESTTTISFKELKNGDIFIGGPQQRVYMKTAWKTNVLPVLFIEKNHKPFAHGQMLKKYLCE